MSRILFSNISELITNEGVAKKGGVLVTEKDLGIIKNAALILDSKQGVLWFGKNSDIPRALARSARKKNLRGKILTPALVDCHTHLVFAGSRANEFAMRLRGATYQEIAAAGGGIKSTVEATRHATEEELFLLGKERLIQMLKLGVGIIEIKSGYGLDWPSEKKILQVIKRLKNFFKRKVLIHSTFLGAHAFPPEIKSAVGREQYVNELTNNMLPAVAAGKLAGACDVFFDEGYFNAAQTQRILKKAKSLGLKIKLHADELANTGGAMLAARLGALSADHLLKAAERGLRAMGKRGVVAVLLPSTAFYLGLPYASVKKMRKARVCMALATDFNPGSSPTLHLPFVLSLAVLETQMTPAEAFAAATYGGARALGIHAQHGHIQQGGSARLAVFNCSSYLELIQQVAHPGLCAGII